MQYKELHIRSLFILFVIAILKRTWTIKRETSRTSSGGLAVKKCQFSISPLKIPKVLYNWFFRLLLSSFNCYFDMTPGWANCRSLSEMCVRNSRHNVAQTFMQSHLLCVKWFHKTSPNLGIVFGRLKSILDVW